MSQGKVFLIGAGPGDPGLLTRKGAAILRSADAVVYDRLIGKELLELARPDAELVYVGKAAGQHSMTQDEINEVIVRLAKEGKSVCRLKGGDPFVFGRGGEEALFCLAHGVPFEIVPGVSSALAAPAYAGIPVTHREVATSFAVVTGHTASEEAPPENFPHAETLVFLMGVKALPLIVQRLRERGESPDKPMALVRWGTTQNQQVVTGTLATIEDEVARSGLKPPALIVAGEVVKLREQLRWFDNRPLWGQTVVVTRAREQASSLVEELRALGARVVQCPTIKVEPLEDYTVLDSALNQLSQYRWLVFTSSNGVDGFWSRLSASGRDARALGSAKIMAIGPATAKALEAHGLIPDLVPETSISEVAAEALLASLSQAERPYNPVLILRAQEGRDVLPKTLEKVGIPVTLAPSYRTVPDVSEAPEVVELLAEGKLNWVTFSSSSTVKNFLDAVGRETVKAARGTFKIAAIGPVTADSLRSEGLEPDVVASSPSVEALAQSMATLK